MAYCKVERLVDALDLLQAEAAKALSEPRNPVLIALGNITVPYAFLLVLTRRQASEHLFRVLDTIPSRLAPSQSKILSFLFEFHV